MWRTCCYEIKTDIVVPLLPEGEASVLYIFCRRGRGHPGAVSTSSDPCDESVPSPDPDIWEENTSTTLIVPHLFDLLIPM